MINNVAGPVNISHVSPQLQDLHHYITEAYITSISHHDDHLSKKRVKSQLILQQFQSQQLQGPERGGACCGAGWWPPQTWEGWAVSIVSVSKSTVPAFCLDTPDALYNHMLILSNSETLTKIGHIMECCLLIIKHFESTTIRILNRMSY